MPRFSLFLAVAALVCAGGGGAILAEGPASAVTTTALEAMRLLPKGAAARVAFIEAREGTPVPERWHILVHDPKEENGLHEYVVANGEIVASRALSQFAESVSPEEVFGETVKIDSDRAVKLAQQYAEANRLTVAEFNFELKKAGEDAAPIWNITCLDRSGNDVGHLVLTATKGTVVSHEGFELEPAAMAGSPKPEKSDKPEKEKVERTERPEKSDRSEKPKLPAVAAGEDDSGRDATATPPVPAVERRSEPRRVEVKRAEVVATPLPEERKPGLFHRAGGALQHLFTGKEPNNNGNNRPPSAPSTPPPTNP